MNREVPRSRETHINTISPFFPAMLITYLGGIHIYIMSSAEGDWGRGVSEIVTLLDKLI